MEWFLPDKVSLGRDVESVCVCVIAFSVIRIYNWVFRFFGLYPFYYCSLDGILMTAYLALKSQISSNLLLLVQYQKDPIQSE
jgi:hypothetical protein